MQRSAGRPTLVTLILLTALATLALNMFLPSLANIARDLKTSYGLVSLAMSGYLAVTAIVQLVAGPLSDRIGRRPVLLGALVVFVLASIGCAMAQDITTFLVFRMLQGGMITGYALSLAIVRDTSSERDAAGIIGYISMAMAIAPMLGPMLGGMLDTAMGWRSVFYVYALTGVLLWILCWVDLHETRPVATHSAGAASGQMMDLLRVPLFWVYSLCSAFTTGAFYIFLTGVPLVSQAQFGVTTTEVGFFIGTITLGFMGGSLVAGRLAPHSAPLIMMMAGRVIAALGLLTGLAALMLGHVSAWMFFGSTVFVGLGNGITLPSCNAAAMSVRPHLAGTAAGANGALVVACGAVLTSLTGGMLSVQNPALVLTGLMLMATAAGTLCVFVAHWLESRDPPS